MGHDVEAYKRELTPSLPHFPQNRLLPLHFDSSSLKPKLFKLLQLVLRFSVSTCLDFELFDCRTLTPPFERWLPDEPRRHLGSNHHTLGVNRRIILFLQLTHGHEKREPRSPSEIQTFLSLQRQDGIRKPRAATAPFSTPTSSRHDSSTPKL